MSIVSVHALSTGSLTLPERFFITPSDQEARRTVPSLSFLVQHESQLTDNTTRIVFDLGLRKDISLYPTILQNHCHSRQPMSTQPDAVESLAKGGLSVDDIDVVIFSHVHYDHVGLPRDFANPKTKFIVGPGALDLLSGKSQLNIGSHSHFEADLLPLERTIELSPTAAKDNVSDTGTTLPGLNLTWRPLSGTPFEHTVDLFSDGSVYIINAPGHLPGHINLLCRISTTPGAERYALLAGDACHDIRLYTGEADIATWKDEDGRSCCIHADIPAAKETIAKLREVGTNGMMIDRLTGDMDENAGSGLTPKAEVEVVFAHNWEWEVDAKRRGRFWPGKL